MESTFLCALFPGLGDFTISPSLLVGIGLRTTHIIWRKHKAKGWVYSARLSPLYPFHLSLSYLSLPLLSLPPSLYLSYLSFSLSPFLCLLPIILFDVFFPAAPSIIVWRKGYRGSTHRGWIVHYVYLVDKHRVHSHLSSSVMQSLQGIQSGMFMIVYYVSLVV